MGKDSFDDSSKLRGCEIFWKPGMNLTMRKFMKKIKNGKTIVKREPADSFFNFFNPLDRLRVDHHMASAIDELIEADVELGEAIRNDLIPRALHYFLDVEEGEEEEECEEDVDGK